METKLCRICGKLGENYVHIFRSEGLKNKIETCLPIVVSRHCLLPDTICAECMDNVDNFYSFIKNCLQNIIVLEAQYDIMESCLKTKRKHEKGCCAAISPPAPPTSDRAIQTDLIPPAVTLPIRDLQKLSDALANAERILNDADADVDPTPTAIHHQPQALVSYRIDSDSEEDENTLVASKRPSLLLSHRNYFDETGNDIINEIAQRKKRKCEQVDGRRTKRFKLDVGNRRKSRPPRKCLPNPSDTNAPALTFDSLEEIYGGLKREEPEEIPEEMVTAHETVLPQICLLCEMQFSVGTDLATHVFETHGIDMAQVISSVPVMEKRKKIPNLVKITDLKDANRLGETEEPPNLQPTFVCPLCPAVLTNRTDLFIHLRIKHTNNASLLCGLCLYVAKTYVDLIEHLESCKLQHQATGTHTCRICYYSDDNSKAMENHVAVHEFVLAFCRKEAKMYDPCDYIESLREPSPTPRLSCSECGLSGFTSAKEFSAHRRSQHQIFHCDLCNKFYGRNSHLWKHVNRLHKGHPSITCQLCYKTSASKYHLAQHFNKIHTAKPCRQRSDDFLTQKFQGFDFQSVKQSFLRQELMERDPDDSCSKGSEDFKKVTPNRASPPKEIDASSNLYTNIITNYTPPQNKGEYKCPKCFKGFHKKPLLKKHKKNCRPRLQKDLLTRCKTCSRIFKDRQSLTKHLVNYHSEYTCEICGQKVQSKCEIVSHIRFSHPNCHLVCHCGNILRSRSDLTDHKKDHRNSFVCQFCADMLPTKIKLKMHILSLHRKILSLSCGICLKLFETQHILRDHVKLVHGNQLSPLTSCTVCGKNYGSKWKTYDHLNKSHGRIFRACKVCLDVFDSEVDLQTHFDSSHSGTQTNTPRQPPPPPPAPKFDSDEEVSEQEEENSDELEECDDLNDHKVSLLEQRLLLGQQQKDETQNPLQNSSKRTVYVNSNAPSVCEICMKTWPAKKHLWQHYIRCHKSVAATVCGICLQTNTSYKSLQIHLQLTHPTLLHGQGFGSNFICRICGRYHNASSKLNLHMAIHENFDWSLLEQFPVNGEANESVTNGYSEEEEEGEEEEEKVQVKVEPNDGNEMYESMIEQVECSSDSNQNDESSSEDDDEEEEEEATEESASEGNSLESEMLQNMLREKYGSAENRKDSTSDSEDESSESSASDSSEDNNNEEDEQQGHKDLDEVEQDFPGFPQQWDDGVFVCKPEELDSAIQSIKYETVEDAGGSIDDEPCELQTHSLNPHEIQTAVDSIL